MAREYSLVVISGLEEIDAVVTHKVNDAVFLGQSPGPDSRSDMLKRFGFPHPFKRISHHGFY